ncbi:MAG: glycosyltransferase [Bacteroidales bacterium]|nr:glycosyltransferase [Bacteroidales bacterium]
MRVLQLCHKIPYPPADGGSIAMHQITEGLWNAGHKVKVIALNFKGCEVCPDEIPENYRKKADFEAQTIDTRIKPWQAFLNLFSKKSYNVARFYSKAMEQRLELVLREDDFDIIQMEGLYLTPYIAVIRKFSPAKLLYRSHNIEHFIWERMAGATSNPLKKWYLRLLAKRLKKYEMEVIHQVDGLVAISPIDLDFFRKNGFGHPAIVVPVTMPRLVQPAGNPEVKTGTVFHLGSMDWRPNQEGIEWFLEKVWPLVIKQAPDMKFFLAGKRLPPKYFRYASNNVVVAGEVPSAVDFMADKQIMVVPLLSGGGMRVKIIEGMAAAKTIISTTIGAEGIGCEDGRQILLADKPADMARLIVECRNDPAMAASIGNGSLDFVQKHYSPEAVMPRLIKFYQGFYND